MKRLVSIAALLAASATAPAAMAQDVSVSVTTDLVTDYVFRGASLADTAIQPGVEVSVGDFTVGGWFSTGIGDTSIAAGDEFDLYAGYSFSLSETVGLDVGATYYHYPQGGGFFETKDGAAGTYEIYAGLSVDAPLAPSVTAYYDLTLEAFTIEGNLGYSVPVSDKSSFDLGGTVGHVDGDGFSYEWAQASASLGFALSDDVSAYVGGNFTLNSEDVLNYSKILAGDPKDSLFWVGTGIAAGF